VPVVLNKVLPGISGRQFGNPEEGECPPLKAATKQGCEDVNVDTSEV
jgi:hypothetical protein